MAARQHIAQFVNGSDIGGAGILLEDGSSQRQIMEGSLESRSHAETIKRDILGLARKHSTNETRKK